jgi:hypothetical protein
MQRPPLLGFHGAPRTRSRRPGTVIGSVRPVRRSPPCGYPASGPCTLPKQGTGPPCASAPLQRSSRRHPHGACARPQSHARTPRCLSWTSLPDDTYRHGGVLPDDASDVVARHVRGLGTPLATSHRPALRPETPLGVARLPTPRKMLERPWACSFKGLFLSHERYLFRGPAFLPVPRLAPPEGDDRDTRPPTRRCSRGESVRSGLIRDGSQFAASRRSLPGVFPSSELAPRTHRLPLWSRSLPSHPSAG